MLPVKFFILLAAASALTTRAFIRVGPASASVRWSKLSPVRRLDGFNRGPVRSVRLAAVDGSSKEEQDIAAKEAAENNLKVMEGDGNYGGDIVVLHRRKKSIKTESRRLTGGSVEAKRRRGRRPEDLGAHSARMSGARRGADVASAAVLASLVVAVACAWTTAAPRLL